MVLKETASINNASDSSKKCPGCGLRNFAGANKCKRCKSDLSAPLKVTKNEKRVPSDTVESDRSSYSFVWIGAVLVVVSLGLVFFYMKQGPQETPEPGSEAVVAQASAAPDAEQPVQSAAEQNAQSEAVAKQIVTNLKHFQDATETTDFKEYQKKLDSLRSDLNNTLPSFVRHLPSDETFRQEVNSALRDYTAAENWWKTTITNNTVFTEADRKVRTQKNFESAQAHLANAEKSLGR